MIYKMKIISFNLNGIRSAVNKGLYVWVKAENPDILCVQETKAQAEQIEVEKFKELGYFSYIHSAKKLGYSGVAVFSKKQANYVEIGIGIDNFDDEGRLIRLDFDNFTQINSYFPSGTMGDVRQEVKYAYLDAIQNYIDELKKQKPNIILSGDYNICHKEIDISNPKTKKGVSGFLPEEREWVTKFLDSGFIDTFRVFDQSPEKYSWWSYRAGARKKNLGWRIDYNMASTPMRDRLIAASIQSEVVMSDHCPVVLEITM